MAGTYYKLLNNFRAHRNSAIDRMESRLWKRNKLGNPTSREDHKLKHISIQGKNGEVTEVVELWKKIDTETVQLSFSIDEKQINQNNDEELENILE